jgi:hypothetical protein
LLFRRVFIVVVRAAHLIVENVSVAPVKLRRAELVLKTPWERCIL